MAAAPYGVLSAPALSAPALSRLRREQAEFDQVVQEEDSRNRFLALPIALPIAAVSALNIPGILGIGLTRSAMMQAAPGALEADLTLQSGPATNRVLATALTEAEKNALRAAARLRYARANGIEAKTMNAEIHHSSPLE